MSAQRSKAHLSAGSEVGRETKRVRYLSILKKRNVFQPCLLHFILCQTRKGGGGLCKREIKKKNETETERKEAERQREEGGERNKNKRERDQ